MRAITLFRAMAWLAVAVTFWSLNVVWGANPNVPAGPPTEQWKRYVVAAVALTFTAALAISLSGRKKHPPSWTARGVAGAAAGLVVLITLYLRSKAEGPLGPALDGRGFTWLMVGAGLAAVAVAATFALKAPVPRSKQLARARSRKKRA